MSRLFHLFLSFGMPLAILVACGGSDSDNEEDSFDPWIDIDQSSLSVSQWGDYYSIYLQASHDWESRIEYDYSDGTDWITLNRVFGFSGDYSIDIEVDYNEGPARSATVVFSLKEYNRQCELRIVQDGDGSSSGGGGSTQISAPTGLKASASGNNVSLSWNSVSGAYQYNVYYSQSSYGSWASLTTTSSTSTTQTISQAGTYYFVVTAIDGEWNESDYSATASCTIQGSGSGGGGGSSAPSAPTGLSAYWDGPASYPYVVIMWNDVSSATNYLVYRSTSSNGSYSKIGDSSYSSYSDQNVSIGKTYYYKVKASNSAGTSDYSASCSVTLEDTRKPAPPIYGNCTATSTTITLRWTLSNDSSYGKPTKIILRVYNPTGGAWADIEELSPTATSASFSYGMWIDSDGFVKCGVVSYNDYGTGSSGAKVYDAKNKKWIN